MAKVKFLRSIDSGFKGPAAPQNVQANAVSSSSITLNWNSVAGANSYTIRRSIAGAPYSVLKQNVLGLPVPPQAAAVGYTTLTFGSSLVLGTNFWDFNFLSSAPTAGQSSQNLDGSVQLKDCSATIGTGGKYGATICTAQKVGNSWRGTAFKGGYYLETVFAFTPTLGSASLPFPAWWALDIGFLTGSPPLWPGQGPAYFNRPELDMFQWEHNSLTLYDAAGLINWYGTGTQNVVNHGAPNSETKLSGAVFNNFNTWGTLVVPATSTTQGYCYNFLNGVQVYPATSPTGNSVINWNLYNPANPPPPVAGTTCGSIIDTLNMAFIFGTDVTCPMQVKDFSVWQKDSSQNITQ